MMAAAAAMSTRDFSAIDATRDGDQHMLVRFRIPGEPGVFGIRLPLPSSPAVKPWLDDIPEDAEEAAGMLASFIDEEVATGCVTWALTTTNGTDQIFELTPYGFRHSDESKHRRLLRSAGPHGWWGPIQESDDPTQTPGARAQARRQSQHLTYSEVGATVGTMPPGYRTIDVTRDIDVGRRRFEILSHRLLSWDMHRRAGLLVNSDTPLVELGADTVLEFGLGPWWIQAPVRIVEVLREPTAVGFTYGTLPGHPERGEERFLVRLDPDDVVRAQIRAFSRPGRWFTRLAGPIARRIQDGATERYLQALGQQDESRTA